MANKICDEDLHALREGRMSFAQWYARNIESVRAMAQYCLRRYSGGGLDADDVQQVILLAVWRHVGRWDGRSAISAYVRFVALMAVWAALDGKGQGRKLGRRVSVREPVLVAEVPEQAGSAWGRGPEITVDDQLDASGALARMGVVDSWLVGEVCRGRTAGEIARAVARDDVLCCELDLTRAEQRQRGRVGLAVRARLESVATEVSL